MKRPPFNRNKWRTRKSKTGAAGKASANKPPRRGGLRASLFLIVGISLVQYLNTGGHHLARGYVQGNHRKRR